MSVRPFADASAVNGLAVVLSGVSRAAIFTASSRETVDSVPPAVEDRIGNAGSFIGVEDATSLQAFRVEGETSVVVDVAARIVTALSHVGVHTFLLSADLRSVPGDPFAI